MILSGEEEGDMGGEAERRNEGEEGDVAKVFFWINFCLMRSLMAFKIAARKNTS